MLVRSLERLALRESGNLPLLATRRSVVTPSTAHASAAPSSPHRTRTAHVRHARASPFRRSAARRGAVAPAGVDHLTQRCRAAWTVGRTGARGMQLSFRGAWARPPLPPPLPRLRAIHWGPEHARRAAEDLRCVSSRRAARRAASGVYLPTGYPHPFRRRPVMRPHRRGASCSACAATAAAPAPALACSAGARAAERRPPPRVRTRVLLRAPAARALRSTAQVPQHPARAGAARG